MNIEKLKLSFITRTNYNQTRKFFTEKGHWKIEL